MITIAEPEGNTLALTLNGRFNAEGADDFLRAAAINSRPQIKRVVADMSAVDFVSSAGLRALLLVYKTLRARGGSLELRGVSDYCREILRITRFDALLLNEKGRPLRIPLPAQPAAGAAALSGRGDRSLTIETDIGVFESVAQGASDGMLFVSGMRESALFARLGEHDVMSRPAGPDDVLLGIGGIGKELNHFFPVLGHVMAAGGAVMWTPTDGRARPDYLLLENVAERLELRLGWALSFSSGFDEELVFESAGDAGASMSDLYAVLFALGRMRRPGFRGAVATAMCAQMSAVFLESLKKAPVRYFAPDGGGRIDSSPNAAVWLNADIAPRHMDTAALICGAGMDFSCAGYAPEAVRAAFAPEPGADRNPAVLYNHAAVYGADCGRGAGMDLAQSMRAMARSAKLLAAARLMDCATVRSAALGVKYIQELVMD